VNNGGLLVINNVFSGYHRMWWMVTGRGSGFAIAYNFVSGHTNDYPTSSKADCGTHGAYPQYILLEGNRCYRYLSDSIHGSAGRTTLFRNVFVGNAATDTVGLGYMWFDYTNFWNTVVGNVCGYIGLRAITNTYPFVWELQSTNCIPPDCSIDNLWYIGTRWAACGYNQHTDETITRSTTVLHANYDFITASNYLDGTYTGETITNSLLYASKPSWFGFLKWPPIDPSDPNYSTSITNIPAGYRYTFGSDPPPDVSAPRNLRVIGTTRVGTLRAPL
jgi:hypothetical protein